MTGFSRFAFQISNHIMFVPVYAYQRTQAGVRMYIIMCTCINYSLICNQMLKSYYAFVIWRYVQTNPISV